MDKTSILYLQTVACSGKGLREDGYKGLVKVFTEDGEITFDAFKGMGADYGRREETLITVRENYGNDVIFRGTFEELAKVLKARNKYGMTLQELRDEIAAFTGDKKSEAMRKARIFAHHISLRHVCRVRLGFGKYSKTVNGETVYYGENRNTLHFFYTFTDGSTDQFSIIE